MTDLLHLSGGGLQAAIKPFGAELQSLRTADGSEWLWQGDPSVWKGRSPILFPVVGRSPAGQVEHEAQRFEMSPHGFARDLPFEVIHTGPDSCELRLSPNAHTQTAFPFNFELTVSYGLREGALRVAAQARNLDARPMPTSLGFHPAFALPDDAARAVRLPASGALQLHRPDGAGLLLPASPTDLGSDKSAAIAQDTFNAGALIYVGDLGGCAVLEGGRRRVEFEFEGANAFGVWSLAPDRYVCLEPWIGMPPQEGASAELADRPGAVVLAPGEVLDLSMRIRLEG